MSRYEIAKQLQVLSGHDYLVICDQPDCMAARNPGHYIADWVRVHCADGLRRDYCPAHAHSVRRAVEAGIIASFENEEEA